MAARCATVLMTWGVGQAGKLPANGLLPDGGGDDNSSTTGGAKVGGSASSAASAGAGEAHDGAPASKEGYDAMGTTSTLEYVEDDGYAPAADAKDEDADTGAATRTTCCSWFSTWWGRSAPQPTEKTPLTEDTSSSPV